MKTIEITCELDRSSIKNIDGELTAKYFFLVNFSGLKYNIDNFSKDLLRDSEVLWEHKELCIDDYYMFTTKFQNNEKMWKTQIKFIINTEEAPQQKRFIKIVST